VFACAVLLTPGSDHALHYHKVGTVRFIEIEAGRVLVELVLLAHLDLVDLILLVVEFVWLTVHRHVREFAQIRGPLQLSCVVHLTNALSLANIHYIPMYFRLRFLRLWHIGVILKVRLLIVSIERVPKCYMVFNGFALILTKP
jgi:hypothetical protein